jgi:hypothetical protein
MNEFDLAIMIGKACGLKEILPQEHSRPTARDNSGKVIWLPNYLYDWNATHEMVQTLTEKERIQWLHHMGNISDKQQRPKINAEFLLSPKKDWCEAFLRVKGLWKDSYEH